jgi:uncharacterized membrane protein
MSEAPQTPPQPPPKSAPPSPPSPSGGIEQNVAGALAYFVIVAIVWLVLEPYNKNRFHSIQAIGLAVVFTGLSIVLSAIPILGWIVLLFLPILGFVVWVICFVKAFQNEMFKLPIIGDFAEKQADAMGGAG